MAAYEVQGQLPAFKQGLDMTDLAFLDGIEYASVGCFVPCVMPVCFLPIVL